jgi:hypothetical protein
MSDLVQQWFDEGRITVPPIRIARVRRGKRVIIPPEWRGRTTDKQTIRKRHSKMQGGATTKNRHYDRQRKMTGRGAESGLYKGLATAPSIEEWDE